MPTVNTQNAPNSASPLWIIALFIALCEVMAGVAAVVSDGVPQMIFAVFAVSFPIGVLGVFVWLLLEHPANLYSPAQYTDETPIGTFAAVLNRQSRANSIVYSHAIGEAIASATEVPGPDETWSVDALREHIAVAIDRGVENRSVSIVRPDGLDPVHIPVTDETTVGELLDSIYLEIAPLVRPYTYGESWLLVGENGTTLDRIGTSWAQRGGRSRDERPLATVGIAPGMTFALRLL